MESEGIEVLVKREDLDPSFGGRFVLQGKLTLSSIYAPASSCGPWMALSRSISTFKSEVFLAIAHRLNRNMTPVMTILMPAALWPIVPVLFISYNGRPKTCHLTLTGFALFIIALLVTMVAEVPIVKQIETWTVSTLPDTWRQLRDRWGAFHVLRIVAALAGLVLLVVGAIF